MSKIVHVNINNMRIDTVIGVFEWEKNTLQPVVINAKIEYDSEKAVKTDKINDAMDYFSLMTRIKKEVETCRFELLERLVDMVLDVIMDNKKAISAQVEIHKIEPVKELTESISITGYRSRRRKKK